MITRAAPKAANSEIWGLTGLEGERKAAAGRYRARKEVRSPRRDGFLCLAADWLRVCLEWSPGHCRFT